MATLPNVSRCINYTQMPIFINEIWEYQWQSHDGNKQLISEVVLYLCCMNVLRPRSKRVCLVNIRITATFLFLAPEVLDERSSFQLFLSVPPSFCRDVSDHHEAQRGQTLCPLFLFSVQEIWAEIAQFGPRLGQFQGWRRWSEPRCATPLGCSTSSSGFLHHIGRRTHW